MAKYIKKPNLPTKIRVPYTMDEVVNYSFDVQRKIIDFYEEAFQYQKASKGKYKLEYPIDSLNRLRQSVQTSMSYLENTINSDIKLDEYI